MSSSSSASQQGIDFQQALRILASRGSQAATTPHGDHNAQTTSSSCPCQTLPDHETLKNMGQVLQLGIGSVEDDNDAKEGDHPNAHGCSNPPPKSQAFADTFRPMSTQQLLRSVLEAQQQRVSAYRDYDRGLQAVLATNNISFYPTVCTEATAAFAVVGETLQALQAELRRRRADTAGGDCVHSGVNDVSNDELVLLVRKLQQHEQQKLQYTAALHLEQIRLHQVAVNDDDNVDAVTPPRVLLQTSIQSLQDKLAACVQQINDVLEEIQCAVADTANDDGANNE
jgi:hypothetical protein